MDTLRFGVHDAVTQVGSSDLQKLQIKPASNMITVMKQTDLQRTIEPQKPVDEFIKKGYTVTTEM